MFNECVQFAYDHAAIWSKNQNSYLSHLIPNSDASPDHDLGQHLCWGSGYFHDHSLQLQVRLLKEVAVATRKRMEFFPFTVTLYKI